MHKHANPALIILVEFMMIFYRISAYELRYTELMVVSDVPILEKTDMCRLDAVPALVLNCQFLNFLYLFIERSRSALLAAKVLLLSVLVSWLIQNQSF
jgi:hypothetical protein